jgi:hypothetical protein
MTNVGALKMRTVKPSKLKTKEMRDKLRNGLRRVGAGMLKDFKRTTATWEHPVEFHESTHVAGDDQEIAVEVWTEDEIYGYVNNGTKPHEIWAGFYTGKSDKKVLAFVPGSVPKTTIGNLDAGPGAEGTGDAVYRAHVNHPGTKARRYDLQIEREWQPKFRKEMEDAMREAVAVSGHAI